MRARNPARDARDRRRHDGVRRRPGAAVRARGGERRDGTLADLEELLRLAQQTDAIDTPGRNMLEPNDVPLDVRHLVRALAAIRMTDRVWGGEASSDVAARRLPAPRRDRLRRRATRSRPIRCCSRTATSTRRCASTSGCSRGSSPTPRAGQAVIITPFLLMGAMAPVSVPAALVQQTVEALAGIALVQLIRPGTPSFMGSFLSSTDMKSGSPAFGGPESAVGLYASGQIARRIGLPWRSGGGTLTTSPAVDYQAGYEAMNTLQAAFLAGANVVLAVGRLARGRPRHVAREVRRRLPRCSTCCCASSRRSRSTMRASRSARTSRSATAATSSAPSTRSSASANASGGRRSRRPTTSTAGHAAAARSRGALRACAGASCSRATSSRRSTRRSRRSSSSSSSGAPSSSATRWRCA